ncbi:DUF389 domain-containing protein [soil metagenome]|jgi:uncharacterized hydrophobic protein (TIGR00271 family)
MLAVMHLRLTVPTEGSDTLVDSLTHDPRVTNVVRFAGAGVRPAGDVVLCDVTREAVTDILQQLRSLGLYETGGVTLSRIDAAPSRNARATEQAAPGSPEDAVVWDEVLDQAYSEVRGSWSYYTFLTIAVILASVAVITDSAVLVVGAMVVGPEFGVVAALAVGLTLGRVGLSRRALLLLAKGFSVAIAIALTLALLARLVGWLEPSSVTAARPLTGFIWRPDRWSIVVALIAGCAGVLSQTAGRSNALVGVFISVTTVPAAGDLALSVALWVPRQITGSLSQLALNLVGMTAAGVATLALQRRLWRRAGRSSHTRARSLQ